MWVRELEQNEDCKNGPVEERRRGMQKQIVWEGKSNAKRAKVCRQFWVGRCVA